MPCEFLQLVTFEVGGEEFGVDIQNVQEINRLTEITKVPRAPAFVEGVINLRGKVIPVVNLNKRLTLEGRGRDKNARIIVVETDDKKTLGFIVDSVSKIVRVPRDAIERPPMIDKDECIGGVAKTEDGLITLLDLEKLFSREV